MKDLQEERLLQELSFTNRQSSINHPEMLSRRRRKSLYLFKSNYEFRQVWDRALLKIKSVMYLASIIQDQKLFGIQPQKCVLSSGEKVSVSLKKSTKNSYLFNKSLWMNDIEGETPWYIILPNSTIKGYWNFLIVILLIYTATIMPYRLAFYQPVYFDSWTVIEIIIDLIYFLDMIFNFLTARKNRDGSLNINLSSLAWSYFKTWFIVDFISCIPFGLIELFTTGGEEPTIDTRYNSLVRLLRVPRLYKLLRVARIVKIIKHFRYSTILEYFSQCLHLNSRLSKLMKFLIAEFVSVHLMACVWYFSARLEGFGPDTWVVRYDYLDASKDTSYLASLYWAFTSLTAVGYGDITPYTQLQQILAIVWMILGVMFYTFTIGSLSSFLSTIDTKESLLVQKLAALQQFAKETKISIADRDEIRDSIKYNVEKMGTIGNDKLSVFNQLSKDLKYVLVQGMFSGIADQIWMFNRTDPSFMIQFIPLLKPLNVKNQGILYQETEFPDEIFFILKGSVNLVVRRRIAYKTYIKGSHIGEIEMLLRLHQRESTAVAQGNIELLFITRPNFLGILQEFPEYRTKLVQLAKKRKVVNEKAKFQVQRMIRIKLELGEASYPTAQTDFVCFEESQLSQKPTLQQKVVTSRENLKLMKSQVKNIQIGMDLAKQILRPLQQTSKQQERKEEIMLI